MRIADLCTPHVVTCGPTDSAETIARLMREQHVGDVVVVAPRNGLSAPMGIVTDRDLVVRLMATGGDPSRTSAVDVMSKVDCAIESELAYDALWHLRRKNCRRLPVVDDRGALVGIVTEDDLVRFFAGALGELTRVPLGQPLRERERLDPPPRDR